ncbi:helix-turn-helix transcriptional regulator [Rhodopseudomonas faecalis]|nr:helix-turn-helix transcriptional regulator [Rhodopseudomonas faecalis]
MTKAPNGDEIVILARKEYDELIAAAAVEDAADIATASRLMARISSGEEKLLTSAEMDELLAAKSPLAFYRKRAGLTQAALAQRADLAQGYVSEIEAGRKSGDIQTMRKIAYVLGVQIDDLVVADAPVCSRAKRKAAQ